MGMIHIYQPVNEPTGNPKENDYFEMRETPSDSQLDDGRLTSDTSVGDKNYYTTDVSYKPVGYAGTDIGGTVNPQASGYWYKEGGEMVQATETTPVKWRLYYTRSFDPVSNPGNPAESDYWYDDNGTMVKATETSPVDGRTYYTVRYTAVGVYGDSVGGDIVQYKYRLAGTLGVSFHGQYSLGNGVNPKDRGYFYRDENGRMTEAEETEPVAQRTYYVADQTLIRDDPDPSESAYYRSGFIAATEQSPVKWRLYYSSGGNPVGMLGDTIDNAIDPSSVPYWFKNENNGEMIQATETTPVKWRIYYEKNNDGIDTYSPVGFVGTHLSESVNPSEQGYKYIGMKLATERHVESGRIYYTRVEGIPDGDADGNDPKAGDDTGERGGGGSLTDTASINRGKLLEKAIDYIRHHYKPDSFEITVKAVDMHLLDPNVQTVQIGDVVKVVLPDGTEKKGTCVKIQYDLMAPENTEYTIGDPDRIIDG